MPGNIKGITIEIGGEANGFKKALKEMNSATQATQKELNAVNKALKFDPKNVDLLKQKEQLLAKQIEDTKIKVEKLKAAKDKADKEMANGTEVNQEQYRQLVREISAVEGQLKSLQKQTEKNKKSAKEIGDTLSNIGTKGLKMSGTIVGIGTATIGAMSAAAESTREYREDMNKLETSFLSTQKSADSARKVYTEIFSVLGESDQAVEASQQIALLAQNEEEAAKWADVAAGVIGRFGAALQPETFYESANETLKLGEATGAYTQMLEETGYNVENFNEGLKKCKTEEEKQAYILDITTSILGEASNTYKTLNADIIANRKATSEANDQMAKVGESTEIINTKLQQAKTKIVGAFLPIIGKVVDKISELNDDQIMLIGGISAIAVGIPALIIGAAKVVTSIGTISAAFKKLKKDATAAKAATKGATMTGSLGTIVGVTAAVIGIGTAIAKLTKEENKELEAANKLRKANKALYDEYRNGKQAIENNAEASIAEIGYVEKLKSELDTLVDEKGKVNESDRTRAEFILGQLNDALGTEYKMTGLVVNNYNEMSESIEKTLEAKKADIILSAKGEVAKNAIVALEEQKKALAAAEKDMAKYTEAQIKLYEAQMKLPKQLQSEEAKTYAARKKIRDEAAEAVKESTEDIQEYEDAYALYAEKGAAAVIEAWEIKTQALDENQKKIAKAYNDGLIHLANYEENYRKGVEGYTAAGLEAAKANVANMKTECEKVGIAINEGVAKGVENQDAVKSAVDKLCENIPLWAKKMLGINSPAKVAIPLGEAINEGIGVGIEKDMSAEKALEKKISNLKKILSDYTGDFDADIKLAKSEYELWESANPNANDAVKKEMERSMLVRTAIGQEATRQAINDALWILGETAGTDSTEYKLMLAELNESITDLNETNSKIAQLDMALTPQYSASNVDLAESQYILWKARNPEATEYEDLLQQEKKLNVEYEEQGKKVQDLNDELYQQIQLNGENSEESKKLLTQLNKEKAAYADLAREIASVNEQKAMYSGSSGYVPGGSAASKYTSYHVQYGAMLKSQGVSQEAIDAAARKASGYTGEKSININNYNYGVTSDTAYKVSKETAKTANNLAMQGVL